MHAYIYIGSVDKSVVKKHGRRREKKKGKKRGRRRLSGLLLAARALKCLHEALRL